MNRFLWPRPNRSRLPHNSLIWTLKVTFLFGDFSFQLHVFMSAVICMLCINRVARPLRLSAAALLWISGPPEIHHRSLSLVTDSLLFSNCPVISWHSGSGATWSRFAVRKRRNDKVMTASVLCAAVLTLHHRYQIVCVVKCVSKIPQADESEGCRLGREFQKLTIWQQFKRSWCERV